MSKFAFLLFEYYFMMCYFNCCTYRSRNASVPCFLKCPRANFSHADILKSLFGFLISEKMEVLSRQVRHNNHL